IESPGWPCGPQAGVARGAFALVARATGRGDRGRGLSVAVRLACPLAVRTPARGRRRRAGAARRDQSAARRSRGHRRTLANVAAEAGVVRTRQRRDDGGGRCAVRMTPEPRKFPLDAIEALTTR